MNGDRLCVLLTFGPSFVIIDYHVSVDPTFRCLTSLTSDNESLAT